MSTTPEAVEVLERSTVFNSFFRIDRIVLRHEKFDGSMSEPMTRFSFERGDAVAAVLFNKAKGTVLLTNQFRAPTLEKTGGWIVELMAGMIDGDEDPFDTVRRECVEETGYAVEAIAHIATFYTSPGGSSERIFLFCATVSEQVEEGGGLDEENEDIQTLELTLEEVSGLIANGGIQDAKTLAGLLWLQGQILAGEITRPR